MNLSIEQILSGARTQNGFLDVAVPDERLVELMHLSFHERLPRLFPHKDVRALFDDNFGLVESTAFRNSSLQGAYLIIAARALGLDCGPMSGFDAAKVDAAFWAGTKVRTNFVCAIGKGDPAKVFPRSPRLEFDEACAFA